MSTFSADSETSVLMNSLKEMYDYFKVIKRKNIVMMHEYDHYIWIVTDREFFGTKQFLLVIKDKKSKDAKDQENFDMLKRIESDNQLKMGHYLNNILFLFQYRSSRKKVQVYFPYLSRDRLHEISRTYNSDIVENYVHDLFNYSIYLFSSIFQLMVNAEIFCSFTSLYGMENRLIKTLKYGQPRIFLSDCTFVKKEDLKLNTLTDYQYRLLSGITEHIRELVRAMQNDDPNTGIFVLTELIEGTIETISAFDSILLLKVQIIQSIQESGLRLYLHNLPLETVVFVVNAFIFYILYVCDIQYIEYLLELFSSIIDTYDDNTIIDFCKNIFLEIISPININSIDSDLPNIYSSFKKARELMTSPDPSELFSSFVGLGIVSSTGISALKNPQKHFDTATINHIQSYLPGNFPLSTTDNTDGVLYRFIPTTNPTNKRKRGGNKKGKKGKRSTRKNKK
jgi:hypothetical protein